MTTPIMEITGRLDFALRTVVSDPPMRVADSVARPVIPPAAIIGPPRTTNLRAFNSLGPIQAQWNVFVVAPINEYAMDWLNNTLGLVIAAIELWTPGVVTASTPGTYPSPIGPLPSHIITTVQPLSTNSAFRC